MRCDRCSQSAVATVVKVVEPDRRLDLDLCGHHTRMHHEKLAADGWDFEVKDNVTALLPDALQSSQSSTPQHAGI